MKSSHYNLFFPIKGKYIVYNTLRDSILVVDEELKTKLETSHLTSIPGETGQALLKCGIVVPDHTDEKVLLRFLYQKAKYSPDYISVLLLPTYACNLSCHYCPSPGQPVMMSTETARTVTVFLKRLMQSTRYGIILKLYGGEPLLNPECCLFLCEELSLFCQQHNLPFFAAAMTNGTLLTHNNTAPLLEYLGALHVTLDGFQPYHDTIRHYRNGEGTYHHIMEGITLARKKNIRISVRVNTTTENLDSIKLLLEDLKRRNFDEYDKFDIYFGPIAPLEECKFFKDDAASKKYGEDIFELVPRLREIVARSSWKNIRDIVQDLRGVPKPELCQYEKSYSFVIDPLGTFYTCPGFCGQPEYCGGTLLPNGTGEFNPLYYTIHTRDPLQYECNDCAYLPVCGGGCPARSYVRTGNADTMHCGSAKEFTKERIFSYVQMIRPDLFKE